MFLGKIIPKNERVLFNTTRSFANVLYPTNPKEFTQFCWDYFSKPRLQQDPRENLKLLNKTCDMIVSASPGELHKLTRILVLHGDEVSFFQLERAFKSVLKIQHSIPTDIFLSILESFALLKSPFLNDQLIPLIPFLSTFPNILEPGPSQSSDRLLFQYCSLLPLLSLTLANKSSEFDGNITYLLALLSDFHKIAIPYIKFDSGSESSCELILKSLKLNHTISKHLQQYAKQNVDKASNLLFIKTTTDDLIALLDNPSMNLYFEQNSDFSSIIKITYLLGHIGKTSNTHRLLVSSLTSQLPIVKTWLDDESMHRKLGKDLNAIFDVYRMAESGLINNNIIQQSTELILVGALGSVEVLKKMPASYLARIVCRCLELPKSHPLRVTLIEKAVIAKLIPQIRWLDAHDLFQLFETLKNNEGFVEHSSIYINSWRFMLSDNVVPKILERELGRRFEFYSGEQKKEISLQFPKIITESSLK